MTKAINQAGFSWKAIENKWPEFEEAFFGFNLQKLALLSPEQWEAYTSDRRVVRNWQKIKALQENVSFVLDESRRHGSFGSFLVQWPSSGKNGLMTYLKKARLAPRRSECGVVSARGRKRLLHSFA